MQINDKNKEELFREYFYSNLTEIQLKELLHLNYKEYNELLKKTKKYYNLPSNYRRKPHKYFKYDKDSYYILSYNREDFNIIGFYPQFKIAEEKLYEIESMDKENEFNYCIEEASDSNIERLINYGYLTLNWNWEKLLRKTKLPYGEFYRLFNEVKRKSGKNTNREDRYVYKSDDGYRVCRTFDGKQIVYGIYSSKEYAIHVRNYLESINWDMVKWKNKLWK